jgi:hypothetical protein
MGVALVLAVHSIVQLPAIGLSGSVLKMMEEDPDLRLDPA